MRHALPIAVVAAALCAGQLPASAIGTSSAAPATSAATAAAAAAKVVRTPYALTATAFGSRAQGGQVPADSDATAFQRISCTNLAGNSRRNYEAEATIPGLGVAEGVTSRVWTRKQGSTVSSVSQHTIAQVTLAETPVGSLQLRGLSSTSRAFNQGGRYGATVDNEVARIVLKPAVGRAQDLRIPSPDRPLVVPGLARIEVGRSARTVTSSMAQAAGNVLVVTVLPSGSRVRVAESRATISGGIKRGVFKGFSAGLTARGLDDNVRSGLTPLLPMPCQGTNGRRQVRDTARVDLGGQVVARGVAATQVATNRNRRAAGTEAGSIARVELAEGRVVINAVRGVVNVQRSRKGVRSNIRGTRVGEILIDGESYSLPASGPLEIPGLVRIEDSIRTRVRQGLKVVAVRVTLLDGTAAVVDLGIAQLAIKRGAPRR